MATATVAKNKTRAYRRAISILQQPAGESNASDRAGAAKEHRIKRDMWVCAGVPAGAAPTGMAAGDWILDTTNNDVYWYKSGTDYYKLNTVA